MKLFQKSITVSTAGPPITIPLEIRRDAPDRGELNHAISQVYIRHKKSSLETSSDIARFVEELGETTRHLTDDAQHALWTRMVTRETIGGLHPDVNDDIGKSARFFREEIRTTDHVPASRGFIPTPWGPLRFKPEEQNRVPGDSLFALDHKISRMPGGIQNISDLRDFLEPLAERHPQLLVALSETPQVAILKALREDWRARGYPKDTLIFERIACFSREARAEVFPQTDRNSVKVLNTRVVWKEQGGWQTDYTANNISWMDNLQTPQAVDTFLTKRNGTFRDMTFATQESILHDLSLRDNPLPPALLQHAFDDDVLIAKCKHALQTDHPTAQHFPPSILRTTVPDWMVRTGSEPPDFLDPATRRGVINSLVYSADNKEPEAARPVISALLRFPATEIVHTLSEGGLQFSAAKLFRQNLVARGDDHLQARLESLRRQILDTPRADIATLLRIAASGDDFDRDSVPPATQEREARKIIRAAISDIASNRLSVADAAYYVAPLATLLRTPDPLAQIYDTDFDSIAGWDSRIFMLALMAQFSPNRISEGQVVTFLDSLPKPPAGAPAETHLLLPGHGGNRSDMDRMARLAERYFGKEGRRDALPPLSPGIYAKASHSRDVLGALYGENAIATLALDTAKSMPINVRAFSTENRRQALKTLWHETAGAVCSASPSSATGVGLEAAARTRHNLGGNVLPDTEGLDGTALLTAIAVEAIIAAAPPTDFVEKSQDAPPTQEALALMQALSRHLETNGAISHHRETDCAKALLRAMPEDAAQLFGAWMRSGTQAGIGTRSHELATQTPGFRHADPSSREPL